MLHEAAHVLAAAFATLALAACGTLRAREARALLAATLTPANACGNVAPATWLACALPSVCAAGGLKHAPFVAWQLPARAAASAAGVAAQSFVRAAGPAASLALAVAASRMYASADVQPAYAAAAAAATAAPWLVLACGVVSDLLSSVGSASLFRCGNFGCLINLAHAYVRQNADYGPLVLERMCVRQLRWACDSCDGAC